MMNSRTMMIRLWRLLGLRHACAAAALALAFTLAGCLRMDVLPKPKPGTTVAMSEPRPVDRLAVPKEKSPTQVYRIGMGDILRIDVRKDPAITQQGGYMVTAEGNVLLPYVGAVPVANLTASEAEQKLNNLLSQYIREPDAKIGILDYRSKFVYVVGQVARPGRYIMRADMLTLNEAIFMAGLPTPDAAMSRTKVITPAEEAPIVREIDLTEIVFKGKMAENMLLQPNDIVYVPAKQSSNLTAAFFDFVRPFQPLADLVARVSWASFATNNNNNNNNQNAATNTTPGTTTPTGFFGGGF